MGKQLEKKDGEGSNIVSQHGERKSPVGFVFSKTGPHNNLDEFKGEMKNQTRSTMPNFTEEHREEPQMKNELVSSWEDWYAEYWTLGEEYRRALPLKYFFESQYKTNPRGIF